MKNKMTKFSSVLAMACIVWLVFGCSQKPLTKQADVKRLVGLGWAAASDGKDRAWVERKTIIFGSDGALLADYGWRLGNAGVPKDVAIDKIGRAHV